MVITLDRTLTLWHTKLTEDVLLPDSGQKSHKVDPGVDDGEQRRRGPAEWIWPGYLEGSGNKIIGFGPWSM